MNPGGGITSSTLPLTHRSSAGRQILLPFAGMALRLSARAFQQLERRSRNRVIPPACKSLDYVLRAVQADSSSSHGPIKIRCCGEVDTSEEIECKEKAISDKERYSCRED